MTAAYDIAIVGAGPAGSTLARLLPPRYRILLVDRRNLSEEMEPRFRKACGGLVAPDAQAMLARFGLGLPQHVLVDPQLFVVRTLDLGTGMERCYQRYYFNVDRERFDRWLVSRVPGAVERRFSSRLADLRRDGAGFRLTLRSGPEVREVTARVVVGADGARSKVRALQATGWRCPPVEYTAVQEWFEADTPPPHFSVVFDPSLTDFYGWTIPKGDAVIFGVALPPGPDARRRFEALRERLSLRGFRFGRSLRREAHPILRPRLSSGAPRTPEGVLLIGEAGGFISPSSAEGFSYAFRSALAAARVLEEGLDSVAARFSAAARPIRMGLRLKNLKSPFMYQPILRRVIMATGIQHLARVEAG